MKTRILYEDNAILVVYKPSGLATQTARVGEQDLTSEMRNYLSNPYIGLVHRLDQPVEGILVLGKTEKATKELQVQIRENRIQKSYYAVVCGIPCKEEDSLLDFLVKEARTNTSKVTDKNEKDAKRAELSYRLVETQKGEKPISLLEVKLKTGRHHQIRVQLSHREMPLLGDYKYGTADSITLSAEKAISEAALCAYQLIFFHPGSQKEMKFQIEPEAKAFLPFNGKY